MILKSVKIHWSIVCDRKIKARRIYWRGGLINEL